jgi:hypothetical protein
LETKQLAPNLLARWQTLIEQILSSLIVAAGGGAFAAAWQHYEAPSERALISLAAAGTLLLVVIITTRFRGESIKVILTGPAYEAFLTDLACTHRGSIQWMTKTSTCPSRASVSKSLVWA